MEPKEENLMPQTAWLLPEAPHLIDMASTHHDGGYRHLLRTVLRIEFGNRVADNEELVEELAEKLRADKKRFYDRIQAMKEALKDIGNTLTVQDVADLFKVSDKAVYKWIHQKKIQVIERPGGSYLIPSAQFADDLLRRKELQSAFDQLLSKAETND